MNYEKAVFTDCESNIEYHHSFYVGKSGVYLYSEWNHNVCIKLIRKEEFDGRNKRIRLYKRRVKLLTLAIKRNERN